MATSSKRGDVGGEGNYSATRRYRAGLESFMRSGKVKSAARSAKKAVDGGEAASLRRAEKRGKRGPQIRGAAKGGNGTKARGKVRGGSKGG